MSNLAQDRPTWPETLARKLFWVFCLAPWRRVRGEAMTCDSGPFEAMGRSTIIGTTGGSGRRLGVKSPGAAPAPSQKVKRVREFLAALTSASADAGKFAMRDVYDVSSVHAGDFSTVKHFTRSKPGSSPLQRAMRARVLDAPSASERMAIKGARLRYRLGDLRPTADD